MSASPPHLDTSSPEDSGTPAPPPPPPLLSPGALVLVNDGEDSPDSPYFEFSDEDESADSHYPQLERLKASPIPPLPPTLVFLYMLSPCLKLGALLIPNGDLPLRVGVPALLFFALLSGFARQIWYMLARYVGKADLEDVVLDTFARGRGKEGVRQALRSIVRVGTGAMRVLLATVYLRESTDVLLPLVPHHLHLWSRWTVTAAIALFVAPFTAAPSLADRRIVYATWLSLASYLGWVIFAAYGHAKGTLALNVGAEGRGVLWDQLSAIAVAFSTSWDVPLYAAYKAGRPAIRTTGRRSKSFRIISTLSMVVAVALVLPLSFFTPSRTTPVPLQQMAVSNTFLSILNATTLVLAVPAILITIPTIPIPQAIRRHTEFPISKLLVFFAAFLLSLAPTRASTVLSDCCLLLLLGSNYFFPAFIHIVIHTFKQPLSILIPRSSGAGSEAENEPLAAHDELLQRKERALQRRRLWRRIVWDVGVWVLLLPVGGGGFVWAAGRIAGRW